MARVENALVVCEQCGLAHRWRAVSGSDVVHCVRCDAVLGRGERLGLEAVLALTVTAFVVYVVAMTTDVLTLQLSGIGASSTLPQAIAHTWREGEVLVAITAALTAIVAPALFIALRLYVLVPLAAGRRARGFAWCVRMLRYAGEWNMLEVFTVGALLSLVRLATLAEAIPGPAMFALGGLTLLFAAIQSAGLKHLWWHLR